jgi:hypothetical protein
MAIASLMRGLDDRFLSYSDKPILRHTWFSQRFLPEVLNPDNDLHDPLATGPEYTIDPSEGRFPEGSNLG